MFTNYMNKQTLSRLSKAELINMLLKKYIFEKANEDLIQHLLKKKI